MLTRRRFVAGTAALAAARSAGAGVPPPHSHEADVVVAGTGAAGCAAAVAARAAGASVLVLEKSGVFGGTSAKSGGAYWIPNNFDMRARGLADPREDFLRFVSRYSFPHLYDPRAPRFGVPPLQASLLEAFYDHGARVVDTLASHGDLASRAFTAFGSDQLFPDYLEHVPENRAPVGRVLGPRKADGGVGVGDELMDQLRRALRARGIPVVFDARAVDLVRDGAGRVTGLVVELQGTAVRVRARRGVVFGTGGFGHRREFLQQFHDRPVFAACAVPSNTGDFLSAAMRSGAALGNMGGAWRAQVVLEDALRYASVPNDVWFPPGDSVVLVNLSGRRIVNEKRNYHDRTRAMYSFDANEARYPNLVNVMVYDERVAAMHAGVYPLPEFDGGADYVVSAGGVEALAGALAQRLARIVGATGGARLSPDFAAALAATLTRFNGFAESGVDADFGRGAYRYDVVWARANPGRESAQHRLNDRPNPTMHPVDSRRLHAILLAPGVLDTTGGPLVDAHARVLDVAGRPIPSLYGAGNCVASAAGDSYWGAGATLGNALTFGFVAGEHAAAQAPAEAA